MEDGRIHWIYVWMCTYRDHSSLSTQLNRADTPRAGIDTSIWTKNQRDGNHWHVYRVWALNILSFQSTRNTNSSPSVLSTGFCWKEHVGVNMRERGFTILSNITNILKQNPMIQPNKSVVTANMYTADQPLFPSLCSFGNAFSAWRHQQLLENTKQLYELAELILPWTASSTIFKRRHWTMLGPDDDD